MEQAFEDGRGGTVPQPSNGVYQVKTTRRGNESTLDLNYDVTVSSVNVGLHSVLVKVSWSYQDQQFQVEREVLVSPRP